MEYPFEGIPVERVEITRSAVGSVAASEAVCRQSAVQRLTAAQAELQTSAIGLIRAERLSAQSSLLGVAVGRQMTVENASALFLISPNVTGNLRAGVTLPAAFAIGLGFFAGKWIAKSIGRLLKG